MCSNYTNHSRQFPIRFNGQIVCAHNMATSLILTPLWMDLTRPTRIHQKCIWARSCSYYTWEPSLQSPAWLVRSLRINFISITSPQLHANGVFTFHRFFRNILMVSEGQVWFKCWLFVEVTLQLLSVFGEWCVWFVVTGLTLWQHTWSPLQWVLISPCILHLWQVIWNLFCGINWYMSPNVRKN